MKFALAERMKNALKYLPIVWIAILLFSNVLFAQGPSIPDRIPGIVEGKLDWQAYKKLIHAPTFQQNDLSIYVLRKSGLTEMITKEENADWMQDWHFFDVNNDRHLDAFYSGATKMRGGFHTYIMLADTGLSYPVKFDAPGYVNTFNPDKNGISLTLREDAHGKSYLHKIAQYRIDYAKDSSICLWQVQMVSTTEVPIMHAGKAAQVQLPTQLRSSAHLLNEPSMDFDQDGKADATGNVLGMLTPKTPCLRLAETRAEDHEWSFVLVLEAPQKGHVFQPNQGVKTAFAGWVLTEALTK